MCHMQQHLPTSVELVTALKVLFIQSSLQPIISLCDRKPTQLGYYDTLHDNQPELMNAHLKLYCKLII